MRVYIHDDHYNVLVCSTSSTWRSASAVSAWSWTSRSRCGYPSTIQRRGSLSAVPMSAAHAVSMKVDLYPYMSTR